VKKNLYASAALLFAVLMVLPVTGSVNNSAGNLSNPNKVILADGSPIPPLPPYAFDSNTSIVADGSPIPPLPPYVLASNVAV
jgi:hypothetical protein